MTDKRTISNHFGVTGNCLFVWLMLTNSFAMLLFGYDQGVFGGILTLEEFEARFQLVGNETLKGVIVGSYDLGCLVGALATGPIGNRIGRKRSILLGTTVMMIGAFLQFLAPNFGIMTAGRVIAGVGNGMNTATAPVWASETSKTAYRGRTGMALMVINIFGLAISCWMTYAFSLVKSELAWRFPLAFQLFFVLFIFLTAFWLPESPRWLAMKHQDEKALAVMVALEGSGGASQISSARREFEAIQTSIALEQSPVVRRDTKPWFRLILGVAVQAMQQLTGINIICYYLPYVLTESVGLNGSTARLLAAVNAMTYLASTIFGLCFVERWGRRRLMMYGALGQCCCWLAIMLLLDSVSATGIISTRQQQLGSAAVMFFFLFNFFFGASWQGVSWLYPTEINSTQNRIVGMSYGVATNWLINFGVVFVTPLGIARLGSRFYIIWTVLNGLMVPIIFIFYPETAGRSLEDIDGMFEAHPTVWVCTSKSMTARKPATSNGSQHVGDDALTSPRRGPAETFSSSRNVSAIELAPLAKLRHRQPGGGITSLGTMTPAQNETTRVEDDTLAVNAPGAMEEAGTGAETAEEDEDADAVSLQLTPRATVLSGQAFPLGPQISSTTLLCTCPPTAR